MQNSKETRLLSKPENLFVLFCCLAAALRIFIFGAAFPLFNNNDEQAHFDLIYKYSSGWWPDYDPQTGFNDFYDRESAFFIYLYGSPEYFFPPEQFRNVRIPDPPWTMPAEKIEPALRPTVEYLMTINNHQALSPPAYYLACAAWHNLGLAFGIQGGSLIYWIRFLDVLIYAGMILLAYKFGCMLYPEDKLVRLGIPLILVAFPQDTFYAITNDVASPLCFLAAFFLLLDLLKNERSLPRHALTGIIIAITMMAKLSNVAIVIALGLVLLKQAYALLRNRSPVSKWLAPVVLALSAALPVALWAVFNKLSFGEWVAVSEKARMLGWSNKPFAQWFDHPLFTPSGLWTFTSATLKTFWRGELVWYKRAMSHAPMDLFYVFSTIICLTTCAVYQVRKSKKECAFINPESLTWIVMAVSFLFLVYTSISFDYGDGIYPSREYPYMSSGRLITGVLVPFLAFYLKGLGVLLKPLEKWINPLWAVVLIVLAIMVSEILLSIPVFQSAYNWFHIPG